MIRILKPTDRYTSRYNLHTHSFYCGHGHGTIAEYTAEADRLGLELLGFSEHCPRPDRRFDRTRMANELMGQYEADCRSQKSRVTVLTAYECDYAPEHYEYYKELLESGRCDYLISGTHFIDSSDGRTRSPFTNELSADDILRYRDLVVTAMDSGLFSIIAHPDLFLAGYRKLDEVSLKVSEEIIAHAVSKDIPLEINANGMLKPPVDGHYAYPVEAFWRIAEEKQVPAVIGMDAHEVANLSAARPKVEAFADSFNLNRVYPVVSSGPLEFVRTEQVL